MPFKFSDKDRTIKIYNLRADTREFIGAGDAYIPAGTGLPAHSTHIAPPNIPTGKVAVFDGSSWDIVDDYRNKIVYSKDTGQPVHIMEPGPLPSDVTTIAPDNNYMRWNGTTWVHDAEALKNAVLSKAEEQRQNFLAEANTITADWRVELMLGTISDEDRSSLTAWMHYTKELKALDLSGLEDEAGLKSINWPQLPNEA